MQFALNTRNIRHVQLFAVSYRRMHIINKVINLHEFEERKCRDTVHAEKCSNNWKDLYNK